MRASWIFAGSLLVAACSSSSTSTTTEDAGLDGSTVTDAEADGGIAPTSAITKIAADSAGGGFAPAPPDGSACVRGYQHYDYDAATKKMTFKRCAEGATSTDPLVLETGDRDLTDAQIKTLDDAVAAMKITKETGGGADKPVLTVTLTTAAGPTTYYDSFYSNLNDGKTYVDNIDGVFAAFAGFAPTK